MGLHNRTELPLEATQYTMLRAYVAMLCFVCVNATPTGLKYPCNGCTELNTTTGNVTYANVTVSTQGAVCWHIACDKEVVVTFTSWNMDDTNLLLYESLGYDDYYHLYATLYYWADFPKGPYVLKGSAFLQLYEQYSTRRYSSFALSYVCQSAPPPTPPTTDALAVKPEHKINQT